MLKGTYFMLTRINKSFNYLKVKYIVTIVKAKKKIYK